MEGYLKKWVNLRWQPRYFILNDDVLLYCEKKDSQAKGQIHLKVAAISLVPEDPLRIILDTGTSEMHLRAPDIAEKIRWVQALKRAQEKCFALDNKYYVQDSDQMNIINDLLADIWSHQAQFDETMNNLFAKLEKNSDLKTQAQRLQQLTTNLKNKITQCYYLLREQVETDKQINNEIQQLDFQVERESQTIFKSFIEDNQMDIIYNPEVLVSLQDILAPLQNTQPIKFKNMMTNRVFQNMKFSKSQIRRILPRKQDPNEKLNVWKLMKELLGKDLSRFAVPVFLNEPLSMLQRLSEQLENYDLLKKAMQEKDSCLRLCYVIGFAVSDYAANINRHKKPFNPILGETFYYKHPDFTFISEQVSHHPPITAGFAYNDDFEFWGHTDIKSRFWGKNIEVHPLGTFHVVLKQLQDHFTFQKCVTKVQNVLIGEMYLDHMGDLNFKNHSTLDIGVLTLQERGWNNKGWHKMSGWVKDSNGIEKYLLEGKWDTELYATNLTTNERILIWRRRPLPQNSEWYYHFTEYTMNLNHLNQLPCTDCRLRPDQFALEMGWFDVAAEEKHRLEEKQRKRRREMAERKEVHIPRYFVEEDDPQTIGKKVYFYKKNYGGDNQNYEEGLDLF